MNIDTNFFRNKNYLFFMKDIEDVFVKSRILNGNNIEVVLNEDCPEIVKNMIKKLAKDNIDDVYYISKYNSVYLNKVMSMSIYRIFGDVLIVVYNNIVYVIGLPVTYKAFQKIREELTFEVMNDYTGNSQIYTFYNIISNKIFTITPGFLNKVVDIIDVYLKTYILDLREKRYRINVNLDRNFIPYNFQKVIVNKIDDKHFGGTINLPPGTGKTEIAIMIVDKLKYKTLFLVSSVHLMYQAIDRFKKRFKNAKIGYLGNGKMKNGDIIVATLQTINSLEKIKKLNLSKFYKSFDIIIFDEVHHIPAETFYSIAIKFDAPYKFGLSATIERDDNKHFLIEAIIGNKIISMSFISAINNKMILPVKIYICRTELVYYNYKELFEVNLDERSRVIERICKYILDNNLNPAMIIGDRINLVNNIFDTLNNHKFRARLLTGKSSNKERDNVVKELFDNKIDFVVCTNIWAEGVDIPCLKSIIFANPFKSTVSTIQRIGRVIRKYKNKKYGYVFDLLDNAEFAERMFNRRFSIYNRNKFEINELIIEEEKKDD